MTHHTPKLLKHISNIFLCLCVVTPMFVDALLREEKLGAPSYFKESLRIFKIHNGKFLWI